MPSPRGSGDASRTWRTVTVLAVAAFAAFRLPELTRYALWYDEVFSLSLAQGSWAELLRGAIADRTNPPLFYLLLKLWIGIGGESVAWMRLLPCIFGVLVAVPMVALARRAAADASVAAAPMLIAAIAAAAASPLAVFLANELRAYSLLLLLSATSLVACARVVDAAAWPAQLAAAGDAPSPLGLARGEAGRRTLALAAVNAALVLTHYFGWLVVGAELAAILVWSRPALGSVATAAAVAAIAFAPWAVAILSTLGGGPALSNVSWITPPSPGDVPRFYDALVARVPTLGTAWLGAVVVGLPLAWLAVDAVRRRRVEVARTAWYALAPVFVVFALSVAFSRSAFVPRYLIVAAPAWWLLVGFAMTTPAARRRAMAAAIAFAAFTLASGAAREVRGGEKIPWDAVVGAVARDAGAGGGTIYSLEGFTALPAAYYARTQGTSLVVRPVSELTTMPSPAWLVIRAAPASVAPAALGSGLTPRGITLTPVFSASTPSQVVTVYRVSRGGAADVR